jgi:predicted DNA-binding transcriptional regulator
MELASVSIPKAVLFSGKLTTAEIWAWLSMRGFCATKKLLYYAYSESLASKIGCTADHARAQVQSLTKKGFLSKVAVNGQWKQRTPGWKQQKTGNKRQKPTHYQLKTPDYITDKGRVDIPWLLIFRLENLPTDKLTGNEKVRLTNERAITLIIHALSKGKEVKVNCAELAGWLGLSYRTVTRLIKSVEKKGFLKVTNRKKGVSPSMISTIPAVPKVTQRTVTQVGTQGQRTVTQVGGDRSLKTQIGTSIIQTGQQHENTAVDASVTMGECRQLALFFEKKSGSFVIHDTNLNTTILSRFAKTTGLTARAIAAWMVKKLAGISKAERAELSLEHFLTRYNDNEQTIGKLRVYDAEYAPFAPSAQEEAEFTEYQFVASLMGYDTGYLGEDVTLYCGAPA